MKKLLSLLLATMMVLSLVACGGQTSKDETSKTESSTKQESEETTGETTNTEPAFDTSWASNEFEALLPELPFTGWTTTQDGDNVYKMELGGLNTSAATNGSDSGEPDGADKDKLIAYLDSLSEYGFTVEETGGMPDYPYQWLVTDAQGNTIEIECAEGYCWITIQKAE